jgi:hypothetical protein
MSAIINCRSPNEDLKHLFLNLNSNGEIQFVLISAGDDNGILGTRRPVIDSGAAHGGDRDIGVLFSSALQRRMTTQRFRPSFRFTFPPLL